MPTTETSGEHRRSASASASSISSPMSVSTKTGSDTDRIGSLSIVFHLSYLYRKFFFDIEKRPDIFSIINYFLSFTCKFIHHAGLFHFVALRPYNSMDEMQ